MKAVLFWVVFCLFCLHAGTVMNLSPHEITRTTLRKIRNLPRMKDEDLVKLSFSNFASCMFIILFNWSTSKLGPRVISRSDEYGQAFLYISSMSTLYLELDHLVHSESRFVKMHSILHILYGFLYKFFMVSQSVLGYLSFQDAYSELWLFAFMAFLCIVISLGRIL